MTIIFQILKHKLFLILCIFLFQSLLVSQDYFFHTKEIDEIDELISNGEIEKALEITKTQLTRTKANSDHERTTLLFLRGEISLEMFEYEQAIYYLEQVLMMADETHSGLAHKSRLKLSQCHYFMGSLESAKKHLNHLIAQKDELDSTILFNTHYNLFHNYFGEGDDPLALKHLILGHDIAVKIGEKNKAATMKSYMGVLYHRLDHDSLAFSLQQEALDYFQEEGDDDGASYVYMERANMYYNRKEYRMAEKDLLEGIRLSEKENIMPNIANGSTMLGTLNIQFGNYEKALDYFNTSQEICKEFGIPIGIVTNNLGLAELYLLQSNFSAAIEEGNQAVEISKENGFAEEFAKGHGFLAKAYSKEGRHALAYASLQEQTTVNDSLFSLEKTESLGALREKFERESNLRSIEKLENQAKIDEVKRNGLWVGLGIVGLLSILIINREVQRRKKANQLYETEMQLASVEKARLQDEIDFKDRELTSHAMNLARKNEFLFNLKSHLDGLEDAEKTMNKNIQGLKNQLRIESQMENNWELFTKQFSATNPKFYKNMMAAHSNLSKSDVRLAALLKMSLGSKDIAHILGISPESVKKSRYRLRKKFDLKTEDKLEEYVMKF